MKKITLTLAFCAFVLSFSANAEKWNHEITGSFPVFFTYSDTDGGEQGMRIMSGFNPANITVTSFAPKQGDLDIRGILQVTSHLQGSQVQNSGLFESRVAEIQIKGGFGQFNIGKGFGIFNSNAIGDAGSGKGIGHMPGGADQGNATNGRIGTGYVYANFNPRIIYSNQFSDQTSFKVGVFNPEEPANASGVETILPRFEGQVTTSIGDHRLWAGFMFQSIESTTEDYDMQAFDIGGRFKLGAIDVLAAYTVTEGIGADGLYGLGEGLADAAVAGSQYYVETTYNTGHITYGISYGMGAQDSGANLSGAIAEIENILAMAFVHKKVTENLHLMLELQSFSSKVSKVTEQEYTALSTGIQLDF
ncbi:MAG: hypothetical protein ACJAYK_002776 [Crocinitomicaceae bacterium]|jgi:hypothetical protein